MNGVQLHYVCKGDGPHALLCIPGALGSVWAHFKPQLEHFGEESSGFKVVSFDPRGYGESRLLERSKIMTESLRVDAEDGRLGEGIGLIGVGEGGRTSP